MSPRVDRPLSPHAVEIRDRHLDYFLDFAEQAAERYFDNDYERWVAAFKAEQDNVRAALAWSIEQEDAKALDLVVAAADGWDELGVVAEKREWLERVLRAVGATGPARLRVLGRLIATVLGDAVATDVAIAEVLALGSAPASETAFAEALNEAGWSRFYANRCDDAAELLTTALNLVGSPSEEPVVESYILRALAWTHRRQQDFAAAKALHARATEAARRAGKPRFLRMTIMVEANLLRQAGEEERAVEICEQLSAPGSPNDETTTGALRFLAEIRLDHYGDLAAAAEVSGRLLDLARREGAWDATMAALLVLAGVARRRGDGPLALALLGEAEADLRSVTDPDLFHQPHFLSSVLSLAAEVAADEGDPQAAAGYLRDAVWTSAALSAGPSLSADAERLRLAVSTGDDATAGLLRRRLLERPAPPLDDYHRRELEVDVAADRANADAMIAAARAFVDAARPAGDRSSLRTALRRYAAVMSSLGDHDAARAAAREAVNVDPRPTTDRFTCALELLGVELAAGDAPAGRAIASEVITGWRMLASNALRLVLLERLAELSLAEGDHPRAAQLLAVATATRERLHLAVATLDRPRVAALHDEIGELPPPAADFYEVLDAELSRLTSP